MTYTDTVDRLSRVLARANRFLARDLARQGVDDMVPSHGAVLEQLYRGGRPQPVTDLVLSLRRPKSTITKATDSLESGGYVTKKPNPGDGRSYLVALTPQGKELCPRFDEACRKLEKQMFQCLSEEDRKSLLRCLSVMEDNLA